MNFRLFGNEKAPTLLLIPRLGVSYENYQDLRNGCQVRDYIAHRKSEVIRMVKKILKP